MGKARIAAVDVVIAGISCRRQPIGWHGRAFRFRGPQFGTGRVTSAQAGEGEAYGA